VWCRPIVGCNHLGPTLVTWTLRWYTCPGFSALKMFSFLCVKANTMTHLSIIPPDFEQTWPIYLIEQRTILWQGGVGNSHDDI
jgi:hypothetical protein